MARPKQIEDATLISIIKMFFEEECNGNISQLKIPEIIRYINSHGYPNYQASTLRRTPEAIQYIEQLKQTAANDAYLTSVSYQTIDAAALVRSHPSRDSLIKAITDRDTYYKTVADAAAQSFDRYNRVLDDYNEGKAQRKMIEDQVEDLKLQLIEKKGQIAELEKALKTYKDIVDTYVYPEIANELLAKEGAIRKNHNSPVDPAAVDENLITPITNIKKSSKSGSSIMDELYDIIDRM